MVPHLWEIKKFWSEALHIATDTVNESEINCVRPSRTTESQDNPLPMCCIQDTRFICFQEEKAICDSCVTNCSENGHKLVSCETIRTEAWEKASQLGASKRIYLTRFKEEIEYENKVLLGMIEFGFQIVSKEETQNAIDKYIKAKLDWMQDSLIDQIIRILENYRIDKEFLKALNAKFAFYDNDIVNIFPIWAHEGEKYHQIHDLYLVAQGLTEVRESWKALRQVLDSSLGLFPVAEGLYNPFVEFDLNNAYAFQGSLYYDFFPPERPHQTNMDLLPIMKELELLNNFFPNMSIPELEHIFRCSFRENASNEDNASEEENASDEDNASEEENASDEDNAPEEENASDEENAPNQENAPDEGNASEQENALDQEKASFLPPHEGRIESSDSSEGISESSRWIDPNCYERYIQFVCSTEEKIAYTDCVIIDNQQGYQILSVKQVRDQMRIHCNNIKEQYRNKWNQLLKDANIDEKIHSQIVKENSQLKQANEEEKSKIPKMRENYQDQMVKMIIKISQGYFKLNDILNKLETKKINQAFLAHLNHEISIEIEDDFAKLVLLFEYAKKILKLDKDFKGSVSDWLIALKEPEDLSIDPHFEAFIDLHGFLCSVDYRASHQLSLVVNKSLDSEFNSTIEPEILIKCDIASRITTENQLQITVGSLGFSLNSSLDEHFNQPNWQYLRKCQFEYDWNFERKDQKVNERWRIVHTALKALLSCLNRPLQLIIECDLSDSLPADALAKTESGQENRNKNKNDDLPKESMNAKPLSEGHFFLLDEQYFSRFGLYDMRNLRQLALYFRKISRKNLKALFNTVVQPTLCLDSFLLSISSTEVQYDEFANLWHTGLLASIEARKEFELIIEEDIKRPLKILDGLLDYAPPIVSKCQTIKLRLNSVVSVNEDIEELFLKALALEIYFLMIHESYSQYIMTEDAQSLIENIAAELGLKSSWFLSFKKDKFEESFYEGKHTNPMLRNNIINNVRKIVKDNKSGIRDYLWTVYHPHGIKKFENPQMIPDNESIEFSIPINVTMQRIDLTKKASAEIGVGNGIAIKGLIES